VLWLPWAAQCMMALLVAHTAGATASAAPDGAPQAVSGAARGEGTPQNGAAPPLFEWESSGHSLTRGDIERYSRQLILPALGVPGARSSELLETT